MTIALYSVHDREADAAANRSSEDLFGAPGTESVPSDLDADLPA